MNKKILAFIFFKYSSLPLYAGSEGIDQDINGFLYFLEIVRLYFFEISFIFFIFAFLVFSIRGKRSNKFIHKLVLKLKEFIESLEDATKSLEEKFKISFDSNHDYIFLFIKNDKVMDCSDDLNFIQENLEEIDLYDWVSRESYVDSEYKTKIIVENKKFELVTNSFSIGEDCYKFIYFVEVKAGQFREKVGIDREYSLDKPLLSVEKKVAEDSSFFGSLKKRINHYQHVFLQQSIKFDFSEIEGKEDFDIEVSEFILNRYLEKILLATISLSDYQNNSEKIIQIKTSHKDNHVNVCFTLKDIEFDHSNLFDEIKIDGADTSLVEYLFKIQKDLEGLGLSFSFLNQNENVFRGSSLVFTLGLNKRQSQEDIFLSKSKSTSMT